MTRANPERATPSDENARGRHNAEMQGEALMREGTKAPGCARARLKIGALNEIDAVRDYLNRVKAIPTSLRRALVSEQDCRYPKVLATISFDDDGKVTIKPGFGQADCSEYEPTEAEQDAITQAWTDVTFPGIMLLPAKSDKLPEAVKGVKAEHVFRFLDEKGERLLMLQVRVDDTDGRGKSYVIYSYWDDDQWRAAEPPGELPLWGLDQLKDHATAFIHEGAKAAAHVRWMVEGKTREAREALKSHPWGQELGAAAHLGWVGGAPNPLRTDWSALAKNGITRVYVVTDNDAPGHKAITPISKALSHWDISVEWVRFDDQFASGFDLADAFPKRMFADGAYTGPSMFDVGCPATWATGLIQLPSTGGRPPAPKPYAREAFRREWVVITDDGKPLFVHRRYPRRKFSEDAFNTKVRPFSDTRNTADLIKSDATCQLDGIAYRPGTRETEISESGARLLNCWVEPRLKGDPNGDPKPWLDYLAHLVPDPGDCHQVKRWCATLIARPNIRMGYGLLLFSRQQGTGKSTLYEVLKRMLGPWNCAAPNEQQVVNSNYNDWSVEKQLVCVHEIYADNTWTAYKRLKTMVTEDEIMVSAKYVPSYRTDMRAHFVLCSNSTTGLTVEKADRRFFVPGVTEELRTDAEWTEFHTWLKGDGPSIIRRWAKVFLAEDPAHLVTEGQRAPMTDRKQQLIEDSRSSVHRALYDLAEAALAKDAENDTFVALNEDAVLGWIKASVPDSRIRLSVVRDVLVEAGLFVTDKRIKLGGRSGQARWVLVTRASATGVGTAEAQKHMVQPSHLLGEANM